MLDALARQLLHLAPFFAVGLLLEAVLTKADPRPERNMIVNAGCTILFWSFHLAASASFWLWISDTAARLPGSGLIAFPAHMSPTLILLASTVIRDGLYYGFHRLQHANAWLWAEHELHHSDPQMNVTTAWRHHWLEYTLHGVFIIGPFAYLCRLPPATSLIVFLLTEGMTYFVHLNVRIGGWWSWLLAMPQTHRIHHSREMVHRDKNFAVIFPIWDLLFGTYYTPRKDEYPETGVDGVQIRSLWQASIHPFRRWGQMLLGGSMKGWLARFVREEAGQDLIEYALLAGFISLVAVAAITSVGAGINGVYNNINAQVTAIPGGS